MNRRHKTKMPAQSLRRNRPGFESLERRRLLAAYDGLAGYLTGTVLSKLQTQAVAADAAKNPLPAIGSALSDSAQSGQLLAAVGQKLATIPNGIDDINVLETTLTSLFPGAVTRHNTEFEFHFTGTKTLSVSTFDLGLSAVGLKASAPFSADVGYDLDFTIGHDAQGFYLDAAAENPELTLSIALANAALPNFDARLGILYAQAQHTTAGNALDLDFSVDVTGQKLYAGDAYSADARLSGAVDLNLGLTLRFQAPGSTGFNPTLTSPFHLGWTFSAADTGVDYGQFGSAPKVVFGDVQMNVGGLVRDIAKPISDQILDRAAPIFQLTAQLSKELPGIKDVATQVNDLLSKFQGIPGVGTNYGPINTLANFLKTPDFLHLLEAGADLVQNNPELGGASTANLIRDFVSVVRQIDQVGKLQQTLEGQGDLVIHLGSFSIGGSGPDLRTTADALSSLPIGDKSNPATPIGSQLGSLKDFLANNYLSVPLLDDPTKAFSLLLGATNVPLIQYDHAFQFANPGEDSVVFYKERFAIGPVPAEVRLFAQLSDLSFHPVFGLDSRGLSTGDVLDGFYFGSGAVFSATVGLHAQFSAGADLDIVEARAGVDGGLDGTVTASIPDKTGSGRSYVDQLGMCALEGTGTLTVNVGLFYTLGLKLDLASLAKMLVSLITTFKDQLPNLPDLPNADEIVQKFDDMGQKIASGTSDLSNQVKDILKDPGGYISKQGEKAGKEISKANPGNPESPLNPKNWSFLTSPVGTSDSASLFKKVIYRWQTGECDAGSSDEEGTGGRNSADVVVSLGRLNGGVLELFVGDLASLRSIEPEVVNELFTIRPADPAHPSNGSVIVSAFGYTQRFDGVTKVIADAGSGDDTIDVAGTGVAVNLVGGGGNDLLVAGTGNATLSGGLGSDTLLGGASDDEIDGGDGNDRITGGAGDDFIDGGDGNDIIYGDFRTGGPEEPAGGPGADTIFGGDGDDYLDGGLGNDSIDGGSGSDTLEGGGGNDTLFGRSGLDFLYGGIGNDYLDAGLPTDLTNDFLVGGDGNDVMLGTAGINIMDGGKGNDTLFGFGGIDVLAGGEDNDRLDGGDDNDFLSGDPGTDYISGGSGSDVISYFSGDGDDTIEGDGGRDEVDVIGDDGTTNAFAAAASLGRVDLSLNGGGASVAGVETLIYTGSTGADSVVVHDLSTTQVVLVSVQLAADSAVDTVRVEGTSLADVVAVSAAADFIRIAGLRAEVQVSGSDGTDRLVVAGGEGDDVLKAAPAVDASRIVVELDGDAGNDYLEADAILMGGAGDDTLVPVNGTNTIDGGGGFDTILVSGSAAGETISLDQSSGNLVIDQAQQIPGGSTSHSVNTVSNVEQIEINGLGGNDSISLTGLTIAAQVDAGAGNDTVNASGVTAVPVTLLGGDGDDSLTGGSQADRIEGGTGNDTIAGGPGGDTLLGGDGSDTFVWNNGDGSDQVEGGEGTDVAVVNGAAAGDAFTIAPNGARVAFDRMNLVPFTLDIAGVEQMNVNSGAESDTITVADMTGTDLRVLKIDVGPNDAAQDVVILNGASTADDVAITQSGQGLDVSGLFTRYTITNSSPGNDVLDVKGNGGDDTIKADAGTEALIGIQLEGGAGNDFLSADATLLGGLGDDTLIGGTGPDTILGGAGSDSISGSDGNDLLLGDADGTGVGASFAIVAATVGQGDDTIDGGAGNDTISGDLGDDSIKGGAGNDLIGTVTIAGLHFVEAGDDTIDAGAGDDTVFADLGKDLVAGGDGNDQLVGGAGDDTMDGGLGNDTLLGGAGSDTITGADGDDLLLGDADATGVGASFAIVAATTGQGNDTLDGGAGSDTLNGDAGDDSLLGGDGNDLLGPVTVGAVAFADVGNDTMRGGAGDDAINGDVGNDQLFGDAGNDTVEGSTGDDFIAGGAGTDILSGSAGNDTLAGGADADSLAGGDGNDLLLGDADSLNGTAIVTGIASGQGNDALDGGAGHDTLNGGVGDDILLGGEGNDLLGPVTVGAVAFGDPGNDTMRGGADDDIINGDAGNDQLFGDAGNDAIDGGTNNDFIAGGAGNDSLFGSAGDDTVLGGAGSDGLAGGDGNDLLLGDADSPNGTATVAATASGQGNDALDGGAGDDTLNGGVGDDALFGSDGNDQLGPVTVAGVAFADPGNDTMSGGAGDDTINGDAGNDLLFGDAGNDVIRGALGNDVVSGGDDHDTILGEAGDDTLNGDAGDDVILGADGNDLINGGAGNDQLWADAGNDTIAGGSGNDTVVGGDGDDNGDGQDGNDLLFGNVGNDSILGGFGDDSLYGGDGNDYLHGGTGIPNIPHAPRDPSLPNDGNDVILGGAGFDSVDGGNGDNVMDAGDDAIVETVLAGSGNDIVFGHWNHDGNRDVFGLDGGTNREYVLGGLTEPSLPAETASRAVFVVTIQPPSGRFVIQPGDPNQYHSDPLPLRVRNRFGAGQPVVQRPKVQPTVPLVNRDQNRAVVRRVNVPVRLANRQNVILQRNPFAGHTPAHLKFLHQGTPACRRLS